MIKHEINFNLQKSLHLNLVKMPNKRHEKPVIVLVHYALELNPNKVKMRVKALPLKGNHLDSILILLSSS